MGVIKPIWAKKCEKALIDKGMNKKQLAAELGESYQQLCSAMSGYVHSDRLKNKICDFLEVKR